MRSIGKPGNPVCSVSVTEKAPRAREREREGERARERAAAVTQICGYKQKHAVSYTSPEDLFTDLWHFTVHVGEKQALLGADICFKDAVFCATSACVREK